VSPQGVVTSLLVMLNSIATDAQAYEFVLLAAVAGGTQGLK